MNQRVTEWFDRFSDDWWDLTSARGLFGGIVGSVLNFVSFVLLTALAILLGDVTLSPGTAASPVSFWFAVLVGGSAGVVFVSLGTIDPIRRFWRTFRGRLVTNLLKYGGFGVFLFLLPFLTVVAGTAFVIGRLLGHTGIFLVDRIRSDQPTS